MTPEERAAYARQILDDLYEHDTDQRPFQVQLAIAEALTAIAQAMTFVPRVVLPTVPEGERMNVAERATDTIRTGASWTDKP